jgi:hypothetical protein
MKVSVFTGRARTSYHRFSDCHPLNNALKNILTQETLLLKLINMIVPEDIAGYRL